MRRHKRSSSLSFPIQPLLSSLVSTSVSLCHTWPLYSLCISPLPPTVLICLCSQLTQPLVPAPGTTQRMSNNSRWRPAEEHRSLQVSATWSGPPTREVTFDWRNRRTARRVAPGERNMGIQLYRKPEGYDREMCLGLEDYNCMEAQHFFRHVYVFGLFVAWIEKNR